MRFDEITLGEGQCAVVLHDGKVKTVGSVNAQGGECDCCTGIYYSDEVELLHVFTFTLPVEPQ